MKVHGFLWWVRGESNSPSFRVRTGCTACCASHPKFNLPSDRGFLVFFRVGLVGFEPTHVELKARCSETAELQARRVLDLHSVFE